MGCRGKNSPAIGNRLVNDQKAILEPLTQILLQPNRQKLAPFARCEFFDSPSNFAECENAGVEGNRIGSFQPFLDVPVGRLSGRANSEITLVSSRNPLIARGRVPRLYLYANPNQNPLGGTP